MLSRDDINDSERRIEKQSKEKSTSCVEALEVDLTFCSYLRKLVGTWKRWKVIYYANETQDNEGIVSKYPDNPHKTPQYG